MRQQAERQRAVLVLVGVGPVEHHDDIRSWSLHEPHTGLEDLLLEVDLGVADESVDLLIAVLGLPSGQWSVPASDGMRRRAASDQDTTRSVSQRVDLSGTQIVIEEGDALCLEAQLSKCRASQVCRRAQTVDTLKTRRAS